MQSKSNNRLDQAFGPVGTIAGIILFTSGLVLSFFYLSGLILILPGAFVGFTYSSTIIDFDKKRVKFSNNICGILPIGKWIQIMPEMRIGVREYNQTFSAYSQGNRPLDLVKKDFRIILTESDQKEIMQLKKADSLEIAKTDCDTIGRQLGLKSL